VLEAIEASGYRPNRLARSLRKQRSTAIGVVIPDITNVHFAEMIRVIETDAYEAGQNVLVCATAESAEKQARYLSMLDEERVAGVILSPADPRGVEISMLVDHGIPLVTFDREVSDQRVDTVIADNMNAARVATTTLIDAGHTDIAFISGRREVATGAERLLGYRAAMREAHLNPRFADGQFQAAGSYNAVSKLMDSIDPPHALVIANNVMAVGAIQALRERNLRIPDDVAIAAIDDPIWARLLDPPLTTVAQSVDAMAHDAMRLLLERIAGYTGPPRRNLHAFELHIRSSSGPSTTKRPKTQKTRSSAKRDSVRHRPAEPRLRASTPSAVGPSDRRDRLDDGDELGARQITLPCETVTGR
jgi:DNA-binding LacI/PurR family transcriptional regulator